jgi:hypothetical protein
MGGAYKVVPFLLSSLALQSLSVAGAPAPIPTTPYVMPFAAPEVSLKEDWRSGGAGMGGKDKDRTWAGETQVEGWKKRVEREREESFLNCSFN